MRGFVITILSVSIIMLLILMVLSLRNSQLSTERSITEPLPLLYSSFLSESVGGELKSILGPTFTLTHSNNSTILFISDAVDSTNYSSDLSSLSSFLSGEVSTRTASNISANFTNISSGVNRIFFDEDYIYTNDHSTNTSLLTRSGSTNATSYSINFTSTAIRSAVTNMNFSPNGTLNVTVIYTDLNGTVTAEGSVFPDALNTLVVSYESGCFITLDVGRINSNDGSLRIKATNCQLPFTYEAVIPKINETKRSGYQYDAILDYRQGNVRKVSKIGN
ncbi:MAG: hypothetical protein ACP5N9_04035 [Candidatus Bilamarchaeum sp.]